MGGSSSGTNERKESEDRECDGAIADAAEEAVAVAAAAAAGGGCFLGSNVEPGLGITED